MYSKSKAKIKHVMLCLSLCMLTGLFLNVAINSNNVFIIQDISFQGVTGTSLVFFGIGMNKFSDFFNTNGQRIELEQNTRSRIYNLIMQDEGIHLREVCRKLNKKMGVIQYHINVLERAGLISSIKDGRYRRFFVNDNHNSNGKRNLIISALKREPTYKILKIILENKKVYHNKLANLLNISSQAITWHIKRLKVYELIDFEKVGKQKIYFIPDNDLPLIQTVLDEYTLRNTVNNVKNP
ncbi:MAG: winged helix-turn-helix transcriptional regulator [Candidatus Helarchaeota archaeon]